MYDRQHRDSRRPCLLEHLWPNSWTIDGRFGINMKGSNSARLKIAGLLSYANPSRLSTRPVDR